ncbi:hypothetical protein Tco_0995135 [Tanacetum coccineum]
MKMVPYEAFVCRCRAGDVVLRESLSEKRVRLLISSPGASSTPSFSPGTSSTAIFSPGPSTPPRIFKKWRVLKLQALACKDKVTRGTSGNVQFLSVFGHLSSFLERFNLDSNVRLNLSFNLLAIEWEITNDEDVEFFMDCVTNSVNDEIPHLYVTPPKKPEARIIPGPAGILQKALLRKNADIMARGHDNIRTTQEYVKKVNEDVSEDDHFMLGPWLNTIVHLHGEGVMPSGCLGNMKKYCINGKLELVVGVVMSGTPNALGDMTITLKVTTGIMGGTIYYKVFKNENDGYTKSIKVG